MKAFLSHSSFDKEFVKDVADQLGRTSCIFDKYSFFSRCRVWEIHVFIISALRKAGTKTASPSVHQSDESML